MMTGLGEILVVLLLATTPGNTLLGQQPLLWIGANAARAAAPAALLWGVARTTKPPVAPALPVP